jgi:hypothetical protein
VGTQNVLGVGYLAEHLQDPLTLALRLTAACTLAPRVIDQFIP